MWTVETSDHNQDIYYLLQKETKLFCVNSSAIPVVPVPKYQVPDIVYHLSWNKKPFSLNPADINQWFSKFNWKKHKLPLWGLRKW